VSFEDERVQDGIGHQLKPMVKSLEMNTKKGYGMEAIQIFHFPAQGVCQNEPIHM
jgi:hypothetical protein